MSHMSFRLFSRASPFYYGIRHASSRRMTNSEAFVETLVAQQVKTVFGVVGSAFMDPLDLFPTAGIRFISVQHEQNAAHMADGYSRVTNKHGVCIAQNGPGISNFVTGLAAAYWAHSPVVALTPEAGSMSKGLGGFQEIDQIELFKEITKYQAHINNPARMAELTSRAFDYAMNERGPTQVNIPRDFFYGENDFVIPKPNVISLGSGASESIQQAVDLITQAKNPVLLVGGGVVMAQGVREAVELAEFLQIPVMSSYLHNDSFPKNHPLMTGPLGYQGSKAAMHSVHQADLVIALGSRLSPFGTNPQYGFDYWPKNAKIIQIDADRRRLGLVKPADVCIWADAKACAKELVNRLQNQSIASQSTTQQRLSQLAQLKQDWAKELQQMTEDYTAKSRMKPRHVLSELAKALPSDAIVSTDIGNVCSVANSYLNFDGPQQFLAAMTYGNCGYSFPAAMGAKVGQPDKPVVAYVGDGAWGMSINETLTCIREEIPVTVVVFNNQQWGAEKKNQVLWFGDRYVGSNLKNPSFAEISKAMGAEGICVSSIDQVASSLHQALQYQSQGKTCVVEMLITKELGDPFRRDAMKLPVRILPKYAHTTMKQESSTGQPVDDS